MTIGNMYAHSSLCWVLSWKLVAGASEDQVWELGAESWKLLVLSWEVAAGGWELGVGSRELGANVGEHV